MTTGEAREATHVDGRALRVLVVDDEPGLTESLTAAFRFRGWEADSASTGEDALAKTRRMPPDVIVLDVGLPDTDGFTLLPHLRAIHPDACVLFLTARDAVDDRIQGIEVGGDDYVTKPFSLGEVLARARGLARRAGLLRSQDSERLQVDDLVVELDTHMVQRGGDQIDLTATEFAVLSYLAARPKRVVSKEELLEQVWGYDFGASSHVVELYISYVRKKIDAGRPPLIHTVRGIGYSMRPSSA